MAKKGKRKPHIKQRDYSDRNITGVKGHKRDRKKLVPPLAQIGEIQLSSWKDAAIPNIIWACILAAHLERDQYLELFRQIVSSTREGLDNYEDTYITHNQIALRTDHEFEIMFAPLFGDEQIEKLLSSMLLIECMPDRALWEKKLPAPDPEMGWDTLAMAIAQCIDHQSEKSTDIRWLKVAHKIAIGKMFFAAKMSDRIEELRLYPNKGDMRFVRPFIRSTEIAMRNLDFRKDDDGDAIPSHHEEFWKECFEKTVCFPSLEYDFADLETDELVEQLKNIANELSEHFDVTTENTGIDARHDSSFGIVLYSIYLFFETALTQHHQVLSGRLVLRTVVEAFITLRFLTAKDNDTIWKQYRTHGYGRAKLAFLKNIQEEEVPEFVDLESLEELINEDLWMEFQEIDLGQWAGSDLRKMAIDGGVKDVYDKYYDLLSAISHGQWPAVRETVFTTCWNPLHRLHRIPAPQRPKPTVLSDGASLINRMLDDLNHLYPSFKMRIKWHKSRAGEAKVDEKKANKGKATKSSKRQPTRPKKA
jgi:hypothetical protein